MLVRRVAKLERALGECVQAPTLVEMREVNPATESKNPKFYKSWTTDIKYTNVEAVCAKWEGSDIFIFYPSQCMVF